jgi:hypothetical protein
LLAATKRFLNEQKSHVGVILCVGDKSTNPTVVFSMPGSKPRSATGEQKRELWMGGKW